MLTSIASLALVLVTLAGVLWWVRRLAPRAGVGRYIRVVESVTLGPGQTLHLVRVANRSLVVASSRERCDLVCEMEALPDVEPATRESWREMLGARWGQK